MADSTKKTFDLNLDIDLQVPKEDREHAEDFKGYPDMAVDYINYAVHSTHEKGLDGKQRRIWGRIQRKFQIALESKAFNVTLENEEADLIRKAFSEARFPAKLAKYVMLVEDALIDKII